MRYIPIVDFSKLMESSNPSEEDWKVTSDAVFKALSGIGFVYITNHGINNDIIKTAFDESKNFFELPNEIKTKSIKDIKKSYNGFAAAGQETLHPEASFEIRESYDICGNLRFFPDQDCPSFGSALTALEDASKPLIKNLLRVLAISLDLKHKEYFVERTKNLEDYNISSYTTFRSLYYPPTYWNKDILPGTVRCADHSDYGTLTLLFQDIIGGLEVKAVDGEWVNADPVPDTVLVNTGDLLEFWSAGKFPATHHRILIPEIELKQKSARQSIVFFIHPDDHIIIQPLNHLEETKYQPITAKEHAKMRLESSYNY